MEVRLHIGAHRTGTSRVQGELRRRAEHLRTRGVHAHGPAAFRDAPSGVLGGIAARLRDPQAARLAAVLRAGREAGARRVVISEENLAGSIDEMIETGQPYPGLRRRLAALAPALEGTQVTVLFSLRDTAGFFASLYAHRTRRKPMPPFEGIAARVQGAQRGWRDVVADIAAALPGAAIVVWPFEDMPGHGSEIMRLVLGEEGIVEVDERRRPVLAAPGACAVERLNAMTSGEDLDPERRAAVVKELAGSGEPRFEPWQPAARLALSRAYAADLAALGAGAVTGARLVRLGAAREARHG